MNEANESNRIRNMVFKHKNKLSSLACFIFAFLLPYTSIAAIPDMLGGSTDMHSIWGSITTFYSGDMQSSYVLYKGVHSVYPYVWLYQLSNILGVNDFFFIKIFFALLFACSALCMPYIMSKLLKKNNNIFLRAAWILIACWIWKPYNVFNHMSVDLPNFAYLTMAAAAALKLGQTGIFSKKIFAYCLFAGALFGFASLGSGQYMLTVYLITLYTAIKLLKKASVWKAAFKFKVTAPLICIALMISGAAVIQFGNNYFDQTVVQPFRDRGEWLPTGGEWLQNGLSRDLLNMASPPATPMLPDNRGESIILHHEGEQGGETRISNIQAGGGSYEFTQYFRLVLKYPLDFLSRWCNRFFWVLDMDDGNSSAVRMYTGFTLLYLSLFLVYKKVKTIGSLFSSNALIVAAFIIPALVPCLMHIEKRYTLPVQALIICSGLFSPTLKKITLRKVALESVCDSLINIIRNFRERKLKVFGKRRWEIPYPFVIYILFVAMCFLHHAVIMETYGAVPYILFGR